ncbi:MAG: PKD domain-containing protein [Planctomycetota bacterium]
MLALFCAALCSGVAAAQSWNLPGHFEAVSLPGTFNVPVGITFAPDGRIFLIEKPGTVRVLSDAGVQQPAVFLDLVAEVNNDWDRGLLALALHPGWVADGGSSSWVYLLYTVSPVPPNDNGFNQNQQYSFSRLTRYRAITSGSSVVADLSSRQVLLGNQLADGSVPDGIASLHNSHSNGSLRFGTDGSLLLATGDGAHYDFQDNGGSDNAGFDTFTHPTTLKKGPTPKVQDAGAFRSQDLRSLAGKVLRLDPQTGLGYPSNPFYDGNAASLRSRVWALGLRNPFRMQILAGTGSTNPTLGQPGVIAVGDVGWNVWEELNIAAQGGANFGWPCFEGVPTQGNYQNYNPADPDKVDCFSPVTGTLTPPRAAWHHSSNAQLFPPGIHFGVNGQPQAGFRGNCAIGGPLYTGREYPPEYLGRLFFADYGQGWIRCAQLDGAFGVQSLHDFATSVGAVVDLEAHPLSGDLYAVSLTTSGIVHIRYGANLTPLAVATANPVLGPAPLVVSFTGSGSSDPDGDALSYSWDFGDGSPLGTSPNPVHVYAQDGLYTARLSVEDPFGLLSIDEVLVAVGNGPPTAAILSPAMAQTFQSPTTIQLQGGGSDPEGLPLSFAWNIDLYHSTHSHPGSFQVSGASAAFPISLSPEDAELLYYRVQLTVTDAGGLTDSAHVWIYPQANQRDVAGTALPIARMQELSPPNPTGGGNQDIEVVRDAISPAVGSGNSLQQYDTYHGGQQGTDDWIGYALATPPGPEFRFVRLVFQEGKHFVDGGWWEDLRVEVRQAGLWNQVPLVSMTPAYPFALAAQSFFDGQNYQSYELLFEPVHGDAIRLRGNPGGTASFVSVGELRAFGIEALAESAHDDLTDDGTIIAKLFSLSPPVPQGGGNPDPETIRNGTQPAVGTQSYHAQFDTFHNGAQGNEDWIGYEFGSPRTFSRVVFQEGRNNLDSGAFLSLGVQVRTGAGHGATWAPVTGLTSSPAYDGLDGVHYETFTLDFAPVAGHAVRIVGPPAGGSKFISVGELRVYTPKLAPGCGFQAYGEAQGSNTLDLHSETPPIPGFPVELHATGAAPGSLGYLALSLGEAQLPLAGGTLLLDPASLLLIGVSYDAAGEFELGATLPADPSLVGASVWLQAFAFAQPLPYPTRLSTGLKMTLCEP